jgi:hypothetical protein
MIVTGGGLRMLKRGRLGIERDSDYARSRKRIREEVQRAVQELQADIVAPSITAARVAAAEHEPCERQVRRVVSSIITSVSQNLGLFPSPRAKELMIRKVWEHPLISLILPKEMQKQVSVEEQEIISGLVQSLHEVKQPRSRTALATKHAILTALISSGSSRSMRKKARLLRVHHRNVSAAVSRRKKMDSVERFEWMLSVRKLG